MATPSEVQETKKCHSCEVVKPTTEFVEFAFGKRAGRTGIDCASCWSKQKFPPARCTVCTKLRPISEFDKNAEGGTICKSCLLANIELYSKKCVVCGDVRPLNTFYRQSRTNYRYPVCDRCDMETRSPRKTEDIANVRKRHQEKLKDEAYQAYGGHKCACCGESNRVFLTLDHINNDGAEWRRQNFGGNKSRGCGLSTYEWCKRNGYPSIFQVLCWNCQQGKRFSPDGICPHQILEPCRDHPVMGVGSSDPKRSTSPADDDMARSSEKFEAVPARNEERIQ